VSKNVFYRYVSVLVELTRMEGTRHGRLIASQMQDVAIRVQAIRPFAVSQMVIQLLFFDFILFVSFICTYNPFVL
jgi:hypothetical protein